MTLKQRLARAIETSFGSVLAFQRALQKTGVKGSTYPSVSSYLNAAGPDPSLKFLLCAAPLLEVLPQWLVLGIGPDTQAEADRQSRRMAEALDPDGADWPYVEQLSLGSGLLAAHGRRALMRFNRKLTDATTGTSPWDEREVRADLLAAAGHFLVAVEAAFQSAASVSNRPLPDGEKRLVSERVLLAYSDSTSWWTTWTDAVLELFGRRVYGLVGQGDRLSPDSGS